MPAKSVPTRVLGKSGPVIPALGFGLMGLSYNAYGSLPDDEERFAILDRAVELGATFWDTADLYGDGEELLGKWFKQTGKRDQIFLATKFGYIKGSKTFEIDSSASYCKKACEESLRRLGIDSIDLYYVHNANPETPIEETMRALAELKAEGKIKHIGLSSVSSATVRRAYKLAPIAAVQTEYSVFDRNIESSKGTDLLATCRELGIAIVCACPLGRGILTATFATGQALGDKDSRSVVMPRFQEANRDKNTMVVNQFKSLADKKGCTITQLALAWLLKQGDDIIPIPGTKKLKYLEQNWKALDVSLSDEEEAEIRAFADKVPVVGGSVPSQFADYLFRDTKEETT
ncbi:aldo/keto reductase [Coniochaeta ligniaria NRRL 30616]|uniref:Aldo/keto reductase n=1 Tax=Coniochaeta ligniaria NRRL 30616 TaxID=1408157 RepID=A0A1J7JSG8_9PEZI|nr:aldo/keto reductase [Coniochaeta ligniaria NRRL 30616]